MSQINKPSEYFNTVTYTGDGTTNQTKNITFGFQPDWSWFKSRDAANSHVLVDAVRGGDKMITSESTNAEITLTATQLFTSTGMTISNDASSANSINSSGSSKVCWGWKAGGTASSNTDGSITSSVSANTTSGFSIVSYTGSPTNPSTVGHGLGTAPSMIIVKNISENGRDWVIWHKSLGGASSTDDLLLFTTGAKLTSSGYWGSSAPNSTTFGVGNVNNNNSNGNNHIAYCFAEKKGFSKFGKYTGNGSTDGTFVYTGFKPAFVMWKRSDSAGYDWDMYDTTRDTYNVAFKELIANSSGAESSSTVLALDILSNGFKLKTSNANGNASGATYIYMAFAAEPLVGTNNIPACAR